MSNAITLKRTTVLNGTVNKLPASKSISNRALIINALAGNKSTLDNLSDANDTQLMLKLVNATSRVIDVEDAGTTMRFLTAYFSVTNQKKELTGTERMKERPIGILVDALKELGVNIKYHEKVNYPPHEIVGFDGQKASSLQIRGDISSQYISALMMIAPMLPKGLTLELTGKVGSRPYIEMTASIMKHFGASLTFNENTVVVPPQKYTPAQFTVESDWSAASYWFSFAALAQSSSLKLPRLFDESVQGDSKISSIMPALGVLSRMEDGVLSLVKTGKPQEISQDFTHCPDLAQTVCVTCAALGVKGHFTGLESLRIKETDRIAALQNELRKIGADLVEHDTAHWTLMPTEKLPSKAFFATYKDHRMAMAFAPLATLMDVEIEDPAVVRKSYPNFWKDVEAAGVGIVES